MPKAIPAMLGDRHAAAEATVRLGEFEADIRAAEDDEVGRHVVEFECLDAGERLRGLEARNLWDRRGGSRR